MLHSRAGRRVQPFRCARVDDSPHAGRWSPDTVATVIPHALPRRPAMDPRTRSRSAWFADRPIGVKIGATVGLLGVVAVGLTTLATERMSGLSDSQQAMYTDSVVPLQELGAIQRSFQGDRARYISYALVDVA